MIKNRIDYKLINFVLALLAVYLIYQTRDFWVGIISLLFNILLPFLMAFVIAYAFYPLVKKLMDKGLPKGLSMFLVVGTALGIIILILALVTPTIMGQMTSLFNGIISFLKELSSNYNINFKDVQNTLSVSFNETLEKLGGYISNGALSFIGVSIDYISKLFIILASFVYFLADMDKIRKFIKEYLKNKSRKIYNYVAVIDDEMRKYIVGFMKIVIISFFEYTSEHTREHALSHSAAAVQKCSDHAHKILSDTYQTTSAVNAQYHHLSNHQKEPHAYEDTRTYAAHTHRYTQESAYFPASSVKHAPNSSNHHAEQQTPP